MKKKIIKTLLSITTMLVLMSSNMSLVHADQVSNQSTEVVGTFEAVTLDVSVPATVSFIYKPDTNQLITRTFGVNNHTKAPVYMNMSKIEVSPTSEWKPNLVSPTKYSSDEWKNLTKSQTNSNVALGLRGYVSDVSWLNGITKNEIWCSDLTSPVEMGAIKAESEIGVETMVQSGRAFDKQTVLTANYMFEFGLK